MSSDPMAELAGQIMADQMAEQEKLDKQIREQMDTDAAKRQQASEALFQAAFANRRNAATSPADAAMSEDMQFIVGWLRGNPRAVPAVKRYVESLNERLTEAINAVLGEL